MKFQLIYNDQPITVELLSKNANIYSVEIPGHSVLFIALVTNIRNKSYWTSIPQGQEFLAQQIGNLIEEFQKSEETR
jgi:hypothetical protein